MCKGWGMWFSIYKNLAKARHELWLSVKEICPKCLKKSSINVEFKDRALLSTHYISFFDWKKTPWWLRPIRLMIILNFKTSTWSYGVFGSLIQFWASSTSHQDNAQSFGSMVLKKWNGILLRNVITICQNCGDWPQVSESELQLRSQHVMPSSWLYQWLENPQGL